MRDVVIVGATRTPIGEFGGALKDQSAVALAQVVLESAVQRAGIEKAAVDRVVFGNCFEPLDQNVPRIAAVKAGFPVETTAFQIVATCGSGIQALLCGVQAIRDGEVDTVIAGGAESMSGAPYVLTSTRWGQRLQHGQLIDTLWRGMQEYPIGGGMGLTAETLAERYSVSREEQDEFALLSQRRACKALAEGRFHDELTPVSIPRKKGKTTVVDTDEYPKPELTLEKLASLPAAFKPGGTVTAGNACGLNDAAAAVVLMGADRARDLGLRPRARIRSYAVAGVDPAVMGIAPVPATRLALKRGGLTLADVGLVEINEAFAAQYLACERELGWNRELVNVNGSGISLGHPVGATGGRLVVTLLHEMEKRDVAVGLATLCAGGGQGFTVVVERT